MGRRCLVLVFLAVLAAAGPVLGGELVVFAAASLTDALKEIGATYEDSTQVHVTYNFAASNLLARQIAAGAPAELFASADEAKMDWLEQKGAIVKETRVDLLSNTLAIVVAADSRIAIHSEADLARPEVRSIAIAEPQTVPAGIYAKQHLQKLGLWNKVIDRVIPTENVRAALAAVEAGNVDAGIVYRTDAGISKKVRIAYEVPRAEGPKISYPFAVLTSASDEALARRFLDYLASPAGRAVFTRYRLPDSRALISGLARRGARAGGGHLEEGPKPEPGRLEAGATGHFHPPVERQHLLADRGQRRAAADRTAADGLDQRRAKAAVHGPHQRPRPHVGHAELAGGTGDRALGCDRRQEIGLARAESDLAAALDPDPGPHVEGGGLSAGHDSATSDRCSAQSSTPVLRKVFGSPRPTMRPRVSRTTSSQSAIISSASWVT